MTLNGILTKQIGICRMKATVGQSFRELKVILVAQYVLGSSLMVCGTFAVSYSNEQTETGFEELCHAGVFIISVLMIIAGIMSHIIQRRSVRIGISEHEPCLIYIEQALCGAICACAFFTFFFYVMSSLWMGLEDCDQYGIKHSCSNTELTTIAVVNTSFIIASAGVSVLSFCCSCSYERHFGIERHFCSVSRPRNDYYISRTPAITALDYRNRLVSVGVVQPPVYGTPTHYPPYATNQPYSTEQSSYQALQEQNRLLQEQICLQQEQLQLQQHLHQQVDEKTPLAASSDEQPPPSYQECMKMAAVCQFQKHDEEL